MNESRPQCSLKENRLLMLKNSLLIIYVHRIILRMYESSSKNSHKKNICIESYILI